MYKNDTENKQTPNDIHVCVCVLSLSIPISFYRSLVRAVFFSPLFALFPSLSHIHTIVFHPFRFYITQCIEHTACMALTHVFAFVVLCVLCAVCCVMCCFFLSFVCSVVLILAVNYLLPRKLDAW